MNSELRGDQIVTRSDANLGFAVALADGEGLIVPGREERRDAEPARHGQGDRRDRQASARQKQLLPVHVAGGTFHDHRSRAGTGTFRTARR